ncbi:phosphatase PAP2 family protein [Labrys sp. KNU-23]|uniref:acid phosphatase n=1 Tax=Labrys sp. KNU-23 TaxID=2789216 RepID=UPI0011F008AC|nr:phosphatase PAP2 family protein [Labrys sp. KNU-23]QEN87915.1 phosphatase PAP2 family protein [Labrys sp. KNU-23]
MRTILAAAAMLALAAFAPANAEDAKPFTDAKTIDLVTILPPPPARDSDKTKAELAEILTLQVERTPEMVAHAKADDEETVWRFAGELFGPKFDKTKLPKFAAFFDRVVETEAAVVDPAKKTLNRPRPHMVSDIVKPVVKLSSSGAYPSGHTTLGTLMGIVLADMIPEKRAEIMARAWDYGHSRLVAGIHYPSDIEMGRISGSVIAVTIVRQDDFKAEFAPAKAELRAALGY